MNESNTIKTDIPVRYQILGETTFEFARKREEYLNFSPFLSLLELLPKQ